ncbi:hypothetical protein COB52_05570 [Candidatus Kaiserbacteria bacterium]|nr:MAG: hypothetical protein COB52_05570 [Candidatus Kaiserbacteria bacterium]
MTAIVTPSYGFRGKPDEKKKMLMQLFAWAFAWGMGGALVDLSKERFDDVVKDAFKGVQFPNAYTIFDYFFDAKRDQAYKPWSSKVPQF